MRRKRWKYPRRRARLLEVLRSFGADHGYRPGVRKIREITGWSERAIQGYLEQLIREGERLLASRSRQNADRFEARKDLLLSFVQAYLAENGYAPTQREICNETGWDRNTVRRYIQRLAVEGVLSYHPDGRRTLAAGPALQTDQPERGRS